MLSNDTNPIVCTQLTFDTFRDGILTDLSLLLIDRLILGEVVS